MAAMRTTSVHQGGDVRRGRQPGGRCCVTSAHGVVVEVDHGGDGEGAARFTNKHSPGIKVWISGPRPERSCLEEALRMLRSFSSARPRTKKVLNWLSSSSSSSLGCWVMAHSPTLNFRPSRATRGNKL